MLSRVACPSCKHVGVVALLLPATLTCSHCGHCERVASGTRVVSRLAVQERAGGRCNKATAPKSNGANGKAINGKGHDKPKPGKRSPRRGLLDGDRRGEAIDWEAAEAELADAERELAAQASAWKAGKAKRRKSKQDAAAEEARWAELEAPAPPNPFKRKPANGHDEAAAALSLPDPAAAPAAAPEPPEGLSDSAQRR